MALSEEQRSILISHIRSNVDDDMSAALAIRNDSELTRLYNRDSAVYVWKREAP